MTLDARRENEQFVLGFKGLRESFSIAAADGGRENIGEHFWNAVNPVDLLHHFALSANYTFCLCTSYLEHLMSCLQRRRSTCLLETIVNGVEKFHVAALQEYKSAYREVSALPEFGLSLKEKLPGSPSMKIPMGKSLNYACNFGIARCSCD